MEFHSDKLRSAEAGIEYARRIGVSSGFPCGLSAPRQMEVDDGVFVPPQLYRIMLMRAAPTKHKLQVKLLCRRRQSDTRPLSGVRRCT
jgi:hypothetical protein